MATRRVLVLLLEVRGEKLAVLAMSRGYPNMSAGCGLRKRPCASGQLCTTTPDFIPRYVSPKTGFQTVPGVTLFTISEQHIPFVLRPGLVLVIN